ncbi:glycosyltransferase family 92 protein [Chitinophaga polysaccharea]|uniref:glycosyltransferase family 92 protein n=1 Tax=Chitinophaga TaxID=79328 RepID=UPI0014559C78|nr:MULTISPECIES: glycosyltransferase family 92 protein [Chitinophaga]NLR62652.1 glycosyltransferase family 92 protein [Chitinophaga polysaccharea]NLU91458.1 glycosyltransferase family 92 protein [Chitinophaga sp. Ak27]
MTLGIHTIFVLRENILFLEEWINYHISIGVDKIILYDNSLSIGWEGSTQTTNKYNVNFGNLTAHFSDRVVQKMLSGILNKYHSEVEYVEWSPKDVDGNIFYAQNEGIEHYLTHYSDKIDWTAFIDMDEFLFSKVAIKEIVDKYQTMGNGDLLLLQKKFKDRFEDAKLPVTEILDCIEGIDTRHWAPKHIIKNKDFDFNTLAFWNVHRLPVINSNTIVMDPAELRFNHYNVNKWQLEWMKLFYNTSEDFKFNARCDELQKLYFGKKLRS